MSILTDTYELNNGIQIPKVGFGTWQIPGGQDTYDAVSMALKAGYRHIDTAKAYRNEKSVGEAILDSDVDRENVFVTSKLPAATKSYDGAIADFRSTMKALNLSYLDLYLIHAPWPWGERGSTNYDAANVEVWKAMQDIYASGQVKAIGVSNFNVHDLQNILDHADVKPMVDQIRYFVGYTEPQITQFAKDNGMLVEAYSPLATGGILENVDIKKIADKYGVSVAQLAIKFVLQNGVLPLPKATHQAHIKNNTQLGFEISPDDMAILNGLTATDM
ncbi:aldo/keto reductase [Lentilactobacillus kefiri]|uniref:Aldehyde reductase n=2 Tax=Lentilactobacillus kefiri TaxID=33962 RepID=A0A8E1V2M2_LENKE|nr:aldo/keto reductase [Lentilactobacillus kefiri]KRL72729.1 aldehyde reductase [Lentilactobacillus parakefiri DSM 10551]KRM52716.1 aldehyde reductase [Lentilactobacillus kefiri DSM 20587 = JCM 5818]MCJ2161375.1 aldo/keto reductase [Lentilactobacillus kefiri]MCP9368651.1 aldo/keto reductase [Lentilactobacillus kefiri]MDH5107992.1 aldo/keto reductase [Lentilactobacillus kefiri]